jgi:DNA-binding Xre family transcriptional regulator
MVLQEPSTMAFLRIRELCEARHMNITALSRDARIPYPSALSLWHDKTEQINRRTLIRVARALRVKVGDLFDENADQELIEGDEVTG